jgi:hypothetical protein
MSEPDEGFLRANQEANEVFGRLQQIVEGAVASGERTISVLATAREIGLELDERVLAELQIPEVVAVQPFLPWHIWYPWRPLWCWWWRRWPFYRCPCDWWWYRCTWWPG